MFNTEIDMQISDSEKIIMDVLWSASPQSAKSIITQLDKKLEWQDKTVKTLINRLMKKNAIDFEKDGREYLYFPVLKEDDYVSMESANFLDKVFKGKITNLVSAFAKQGDIKPQDAAELKKLLSELESKKGSE
jgi:BlaI family transcriptional regulator, penicillinase repressor